MTLNTLKELLPCPLSDEDLAAWAEQAKRDDWHLRFVGSDIRMLIGEVQRLRARQSDPRILELIGEVERWKQRAFELECKQGDLQGVFVEARDLKDIDHDD